MRNGYRLVNGDALKKIKTPNTNFAILNTVSMTEPVQDTTEMGRKVMEFANFWGGGARLVVQRGAHPSTTIYVPEIKFYDTKYATDRYLETNVPNLFVAGDGVGKSRGIVGAALNGILAAEGILRREGKG